MKTEASPTPKADADLSGILTRAGSMVINEEAECGLVISMTREELRAVRSLPMYRRVKIVTADEWNERVAEHFHLLGALSEIQHIWQTQSEACADNSRAGELMAETARKAMAYSSAAPCGTCGSVRRIDGGTACAQCGCDIQNSGSDQRPATVK